MFSYSIWSDENISILIWKQRQIRKWIKESSRVMLNSANGLASKIEKDLEEEAEKKGKNNLTSKVKLFWYVWNANNWLSKQHTKDQLKNVVVQMNDERWW